MGVAYTDDGQPYGGRGGALYNGGADGTVTFMGVSIFKDNIGEMVRTCTKVLHTIVVAECFAWG